jgi:hypothetical protein
MKVNISGTMAQLTGNWTRTEMTDCNTDSLAFSSQTAQGCRGKEAAHRLRTAQRN